MSLEAFTAARERVWRTARGELAAGTPLADDAVLAAVAEFDARLQTNLRVGSPGLVRGGGPALLAPPRAVRPLLRAVLPLVYLGYERAEHVQEFVGEVPGPAVHLPAALGGGASVAGRGGSRGTRAWCSRPSTSWSGSASKTPNQAPQQTAGACRLSQIRSSPGPRRC